MSLELFLLVSAALFIIWTARYYKQKINNLKFKFEMFALRDKIRFYKMTNENIKNDWFIDYLDEKICKTILKSNSINLYSAIALNLIHRKNKKINDFMFKINLVCSENEQFDNFQKEYINCFVKYTVRKHFILRFLINIFVFIKVVKVIAEKQKESIKSSSYLPEFGENLKYANY